MSKIHLLIVGQVQGVGFRFWVRQKLLELGIEGDVWNNSDGTVAAWFKGERGKVKQMIGLCRQGPALAKVSKVVILKKGNNDIKNR